MVYAALKLKLLLITVIGLLSLLGTASVEELLKYTFHSELPGSQLPGYGVVRTSHLIRRGRTEPRVGSWSMDEPETSEVKRHGDIFKGSVAAAGVKPGKIAKRSYLRARRRAAQCALGGTWCRGRWITGREIGVSREHFAPQTARPARDRAVQAQAGHRLRVLTYNIGGVCTAAFDAMMNWVTRQDGDDVTVVPEIHYGMGREDSSWSVSGWHVMTSVDPNARFSGVAVLVRGTVCAASALRFCTWVPGRILHVRILGQCFSTDVVAVYRLPMVLECQAGNGLQSTPGVDAAEQAVGHPAQAQCAGDAWRLQ